MANRRNVLIGLGGLVAGGGALIGTGAFDTVEAERTVSVETAGDADAFLGLVPARDALGLDGEDLAEETDGVLEIAIGDDTDEGLNQNARTVFNHLVLVQNNGTQDVEEITLEFTETEDPVDAGDTFSFPVADTDGSDITSDIGSVENGGDILEDGETSPTLEPGDTVVFGLEIDLLNGGDDGDLPEDGDYTLTIEANAAA